MINCSQNALISLEFILDEAKLVFRVEHIKGVPQPEELKVCCFF
jgi:hypothetical protein